MRILLVEDDTMVRLAMERIFRSRGHEILMATSATRAIEQLVRESGIGLIVLDMMLADGSTGWTVADFRYHDARSRQIPMIVVSAVSPDDVRMKARENWLEDVKLILGKPFKKSDLERFLESIGG